MCVVVSREKRVYLVMFFVLLIKFYLRNPVNFLKSPFSSRNYDTGLEWQKWPIKCINDIHREKLSYSIQYKNGCLAASDLFYMFTRSIKFYTFDYHILKSTDVWKRWFIK